MMSTANVNDVALSAAKRRIRRLLRQLPPHDENARYCTSIENQDAERRVAEHFTQWRRRRALGRGRVHRLKLSTENTTALPNGSAVRCRQCGNHIDDGEVVVNAFRAGENSLWHLECFVCSVCNQELEELIYFYAGGRIYCGRHHAETLRPRCAACDEIIFADYCTKTAGNFWHCHHLVCTECRIPLAGQRYVVNSSRSHCPELTADSAAVGYNPMCLTCYHALHADYCDACGTVIAADDRHVTVDSDDVGDGGNRKWHSECFARNRFCSSRRYTERAVLESTTPKQLELCGHGLRQPFMWRPGGCMRS